MQRSKIQITQKIYVKHSKQGKHGGVERITVVAECVMIICAQGLHFFFSSLLVGKERIFIFLVGDVVNANIMDDCNRKF